MASIKLKGDTSGEVTISAPAVAGTTTLELPATSSTLATQNSLGVRNLIINGDMRVAQRGTSVAGLNTTINGYYTVDRFVTIFNTGGTANSYGTFTQSQDTDVPTGQGFANSLKMDCTSASVGLVAGSLVLLQHRLEGQNLQHLKKGTSNAESITLSFWVKSNKTGTYITTLDDNDNTRSISKPYTINSANTWEKKTITFDGDTSGVLGNDNGSSLVLNLWLVVGTNYTSGTSQELWNTKTTANLAYGQTVNLADSTSNYINITGVQLEVGDTATPFEHIPFDMNLLRCQRYFWKTFPTSVAPAQNTATSNMLFAGIRADVLAGLDFTVEMRAAPTLISYNPYASNSSFRVYGGGDHTVVGIVADTKRIMWINLGSPFTPPNGVHGHITASAEL